jgi:3-(3-hydroxy-phenyl)propionate hydroxylase
MAHPDPQTPAFVSYFDYHRFAPVLPPLEDGRERRRHRVAIVGGGPIGLALALGLARYGVPSVLLEADDSVCIGSRAGCITDRSLEIFEQLGVDAPCMAQGLPWSEGWSYFGTRQVFHLNMPQDPLARYPRLLNIQQCYVEQYLLDAIQSRHPDLVEIRWQNRVGAVAPAEDGVRLSVSTPRGDYALAADYVVAADGARSVVRKDLGLRFVGTRYEGSYVIVDIKMASPLPPGRRAWFDPPSNPGATLLLHKHRDDLWRFDYQLREGEDPAEAVRPENVLARVRSHLELMGERAPWNPVWISLYQASSLTLERYRHGRVLFAGDAAHLTPIFGVRGMNSGLDDTHNLAWKLAYVLQGRAREALLDSYSEERVYATRENLRHSSKSAEFMAPPSPAFALMRRAALGLAVSHEWVRRLVDPRQSTPIGFPASPLNVEGDDAAFQAGPRPGATLPNAPCGDAHLSSRLHAGFTTLVFGDAPAGDIRLPEGVAHQLLAAPADGPLAERFGAARGTTCLIRPDGHLLARWRQPDAARIGAAVQHCLSGGHA